MIKGVIMLEHLGRILSPNEDDDPPAVGLQLLKAKGEHENVFEK